MRPPPCPRLYVLRRLRSAALPEPIDHRCERDLATRLDGKAVVVAAGLGTREVQGSQTSLQQRLDRLDESDRVLRRLIDVLVTRIRGQAESPE